jgi:hypothetical protein
LGNQRVDRAEPDHGLAAATDLELLQDVVHVILDRGDLNPQLDGDVLVGQPVFDAPQDLHLADSQSQRDGVALEIRRVRRDAGERSDRRSQPLRPINGSRRERDDEVEW